MCSSGLFLTTSQCTDNLCLREYEQWVFVYACLLSFSLSRLSSLSVAVDIQTFQRASFYDNVSGLHEAPGER